MAADEEEVKNGCVNEEDRLAGLHFDVWLDILTHLDLNSLLATRMVSTTFDELAVCALKRSSKPSWNLLLFAQRMVMGGVDYQENAFGSEFYEGLRAALKSGYAAFDPCRSIKLPSEVNPLAPETIEVGMMYGQESKPFMEIEGFPLSSTDVVPVLYNLNTMRPLFEDSTVNTSVYIPTIIGEPLTYTEHPRKRWVLLRAMPKIVERRPDMCVMTTDPARISMRSQAMRDAFDKKRVWKTLDPIEDTEEIFSMRMCYSAHGNRTVKRQLPETEWVYETPVSKKKK